MYKTEVDEKTEKACEADYRLGTSVMCCEITRSLVLLLSKGVHFYTPISDLIL